MKEMTEIWKNFSLITVVFSGIMAMMWLRLKGASDRFFREAVLWVTAVLLRRFSPEKILRNIHGMKSRNCTSRIMGDIILRSENRCRKG